MKITRKQAAALLRIFQRNDPKPEHPENLRAWWKRYVEFHHTAYNAFMDDCVMVPWGRMVLGIEKDGHTHS